MTATKPAIIEHPILFSSLMVKAILEGRKTQTRRVVKWPLKGGSPNPLVEVQPCLSAGLWKGSDGNGWNSFECPYGQVGHRLWVRETWASADYLYKDSDNDPPGFVVFKADGLIYGPDNTLMTKNLNEGIYRAPNKWRPSIFLPRELSRINLEIVGVRVERLNQISEEDAKAEGIFDGAYDPGLGRGGKPGWCWKPNHYAGTARHGYELLWDEINGKRPGCTWADSPFVWVIEFKVAHLYR
jgi:hypothetical protein